jgi:hypothetical protein
VRKVVAPIAWAAGVLLLAGCAQINAQLDGAVVADGTPAPGGDPVLAVRSTGSVDGLLSVVLANDTDRTLRYAEAVVEARAADGTRVTTSLDEGSDASCCAIVNLPAGKQYGLYLDVGTDAEVARVTVSYRDVSWGPAHDDTAPPALAATPVALRHTADGSVVVADLTSDADVAEAIVQAFVTDAGGQLLAVVSGRWRCLTDGTRRLYLQLFHPLPDDARVDRVVVHPVTDDPTKSTPVCDGPAGS